MFIVQLWYIYSQTFSDIFLGLRNCINLIITEIRNDQQSLKKNKKVFDLSDDPETIFNSLPNSYPKS